jgi:galactoside O-acetyltransferase
MRPNIPQELCPGQAIPDAELRPWLAHLGVGTKVYRGCRLVGGERIRIGDATQIDEGVHLFAGEGLEIGRHVHLAFGSSVSGGGQCRIHDFAGLGAGVRIITGTEDVAGRGLTNPTVPAEYRTVRRGRVEIGAHAVVFTGTIVLPNVAIGEGAVIAAGSIVHHEVRPWGIYAGYPLTQVGVRPAAEVLALGARMKEQRP